MRGAGADAFPRRGSQPRHPGAARAPRPAAETSGPAPCRLRSPAMGGRDRAGNVPQCAEKRGGSAALRGRGGGDAQRGSGVPRESSPGALQPLLPWLSRAQEKHSVLLFRKERKIDLLARAIKCKDRQVVGEI